MLTLGAWPTYVCPRCRGRVRVVAGDYECRACSAHYPVVLGIPDFRVEPDPWIGLEEDREKARRVAAAGDGRDLASGVTAYWAMTPGTPPALARRFTEHVLAGEGRAEEWLDVVDRGADPDAGPWLEIGCGTGDLLAAAGRRGIPVVGVDVAMRWLVLARRRGSLHGGGQRLVCCNGERLPFADDAFRRVVCVATLEHCADGAAVLAETARVLVRGGTACLRTVNRYSLLREPHVGVWGVGFVPRRWADAYVRWRSGQRYLHHRPLSRRELRRALGRAGFADARPSAAALLPSERARLGGAARYAGALYDFARAMPVVRDGLSWIAPALEARSVRP